MCDYCGRRGYHPSCQRNRDEDIQRYWDDLEHKRFLKERGLLVEIPRQKPAFELAAERYMEKPVTKDPSDPNYGLKVKDIMRIGDVFYKIATKELRVVNAKTPYLVPSFKPVQ